MVMNSGRRSTGCSGAEPVLIMVLETVVNNVNCSLVWFDGYGAIGEYQTGSLRLVPVYILVLSAFTNVFITQIISIIIVFSKKYCCGVEADYFGEKLFWEKLLVTGNPVVLLVQAMTVLAHFLYVMIQTIRFRAGVLSGWSVYQLLFARVINSGIPSTLTSLFMRSLFAEQDQKKVVISSNSIFVGSVVILACPLVTHIIPNMLIFIPIAIAFTLVITFLIVFMNRLGAVDENRGLALFIGLALVSVTIAVFALGLQMMYNYGVFFYSKNYSWTETIKNEFIARNTYCALQDADQYSYTVEQLWNKFSYLW
eukprot:TRINITY_DN33696_c0_g2_i1.p1 TRINITY_DN33696_c0_g2~~TRINITY_DN33696_c0_g2_i1.p1  ORF type:complete len:311 (+),score=53.73 TRINITY_DN33696_c0_g2_i1:357-1289(+)